MRRVIVLGGLGFFGRTAAAELRKLNVPVQVASRRPSADLQIDADQPDSIRAAVRPGDIVLDAAGPFHGRSTALIDAALELGVDVVDLNDDLRYAESIARREAQIADARIRVLSSASTVSAISAAVVSHSQMVELKRVTAFLAPASRRTANAGTAISLIRSIGLPVRVFRDCELQTRTGWTDPRPFPMPHPIGPICGRLFESADSLYLPRIWPTLTDVAMYVDANAPGANQLLRIAAHLPPLRRLLESSVRIGAAFARRFGSAAGGIAYEIESGDGHINRYALVAARDSFVAAVAPAVLAVSALASDQFSVRGLIIPDRHVAPDVLFDFLAARGIELHNLSTAAP